MDQQESIGHQVVPVPGVPGPLPSEQNPPPPPGAVDPNLYTPGVGDQGSFVPGAGGSTFDTPLIQDVHTVNDGPPLHFPGAPVVEQQSFDPYAEETWYRYPFGVGYDGSDATHYGGIPQGVQPVVVEPLPDQNCCEDGLVPQDGTGLSNPGAGNNPFPGLNSGPGGGPSSNPNPFGGQNPFGNPNPYPQGHPASVDFAQQPLPGAGATAGQPFAPQNPGGNPPLVEMEVKRPVHTEDGNPRLFHATAGGGGGGAQTVMVPFVVGDNLPGDVEEVQPPQVNMHCIMQC